MATGSKTGGHILFLEQFQSRLQLVVGAIAGVQGQLHIGGDPLPNEGVSAAGAVGRLR